MNTEHKDQANGQPAQDEETTGATYEAGQSEQETTSGGPQNDASDEAGTSESQDAVKQLQQAKQLAEENHQRFLRAQADFDNFRRRTQKEKEDLAKYGSLKLIEQLLPVVDNFERALSASRGSKDAEALAKGIEMVFRQLDQVLTSEGLQPMETVGAPFNPEYHQAIMQVESDEHEEGIVVEEVQKGYLLKDKVLRPAMVKVSS